MSKKFTSAQRSYKTYKQEALAVIEALMKWEDKLLGRHFIIATDHKALTSVKTATSGRNGQLIRWDEYLSRFDFEIVHVEGIQNKVADCLSRLYENDEPSDEYPIEAYVNADVRLDPDLEDLGPLCSSEVQRDSIALFARRAKEPIEDRVIEAAEMAKHAEQLNLEGIDVSAISLKDVLNADPPLSVSVEGDVGFLDDVRNRYIHDSVLKSVISKPMAFPQFTVTNGLVYCQNQLGQAVLCIPCAPRSNGTRMLTEIVLDQSHIILGHYGELRTSEYIRRWYWWPKMGREIAKFCLSCGNCKLNSTQSPVGLLYSLPVPKHPWDSIGMDFVGPFPECLGYNYLLVVIC
jgi:hypothetical protein